MKHVFRLVAALAMTALIVLGLPGLQLAQADAGVVITGIVQDELGSPVAGADLKLCPWYSSPPWGGAPSFGSCLAPDRWATASDGRFSLEADGLAPGDYFLGLTKAGHWSVWSDGSLQKVSEEEGPIAPSADVAHISFDGASIDLGTLRLPAKHMVSGRVIDSRGDSAGGLDIGIYPSAEARSASDLLTSGSTDATGRFSIPIPMGAVATNPLLLAVSDRDAVFSDYTETITLDQENRDLPAPIQLAEVGSVLRGRVLDGDGRPLPGVSVSALRIYEGAWTSNQTVVTDANGYYAVKVRPGTRYAVKFARDGLMTRYYPRRWTEPDSDVDSGTYLSQPVADLPNPDLADVVMVPGVDLTVKVTWAGQPKPLEGAGVYVYADGGEDSGQLVATMGTFAGDVDLKVPTGTFRIVVDGTAMVPQLDTVTLNAVRVDHDTDLGTVQLHTVGNKVTGSIHADGLAVGGAQVAVYYWDHNDEFAPLQAGDIQTTDSAGDYAVTVRDADAFTIKVSKPGYATTWLGGGGVHPAEADSNNSRVSAAGLDLGSLSIVRAAVGLGKVAGISADYCRAQAIWTEVWAGSGEARGVSLPFPVKLYGETFSTINVVTDGRVTLGNADTDPPTSLADALVPVIAPFWSDTEPASPDSGGVTYGSSPDGKSFCVSWIQQTRRPWQSDGWNTFQLILTDRSMDVGRSEGDVDIVFNYDQIDWDTAASEGSMPAIVGYSAGLGQPGTYVSLDGSQTSGSFTDSGTWPLVTHSMNSDQPGRYVFEIRNADSQAQLGSIRGQLVRESDGGAVSGSVLACRTGQFSSCRWVVSNSDGTFSLQALPIGDYKLYIWADGMSASQLLKAQVVVGEATDIGVQRLRVSVPIPVGTSLSHRDLLNGVPVVLDADELALSVPNPCTPQQVAAGGWAVLDSGNERLAQGDLESAGPNLKATIPELYPYHGQGRLVTAVTCDGQPSASPAFDLYVDPSGTVFNKYGVPLAGASVTLLRADGTSDFTPVPGGSVVMSESNRVNPFTTPEDGTFHWDVTSGSYELEASAGGCASQRSGPIDVPPARVGIAIKLDCGQAPTPETPISITGEVGLGKVLTALPSTFAGGLPAFSGDVTWYRDGVRVGTGSTHQVTLDDLGHGLEAVESLVASAVADGLGGTVGFASFAVASQPVAVPRLAFIQTPGVTISGEMTEGSILTATVGTWTPDPDGTNLQWLRNGVEIPGASGAKYTPTASDVGARLAVRVSAWKAGYLDGSVTSSPTSVIAAAAVPLADFTTRTLPVISGKAKVGSILSVRPGEWDPVPQQLTYQWMRGGVAIAGAIARTYKVTAADAGYALKVRVTAMRDGYRPSASTSTPTGTVPYIGVLKAAVPKLSGAAKVGRVLTARPGRWKPAGVVLRYQWLRSGRVIAGATGLKYRITTADRGAKLSITVTGSAMGYRPVTKVSRTTGKVR